MAHTPPRQRLRPHLRRERDGRTALQDHDYEILVFARRALARMRQAT